MADRVTWGGFEKGSGLGFIMVIPNMKKALGENEAQEVTPPKAFISYKNVLPSAIDTSESDPDYRPKLSNDSE